MQIVAATAAAQGEPESPPDELAHHLPLPVRHVDPRCPGRYLDGRVQLGLLARAEGGRTLSLREGEGDRTAAAKCRDPLPDRVRATFQHLSDLGSRPASGEQSECVPALAFPQGRGAVHLLAHLAHINLPSLKQGFHRSRVISSPVRSGRGERRAWGDQADVTPDRGTVDGEEVRRIGRRCLWGGRREEVQERPWREDAQRAECRIAIEHEEVGIAGDDHVGVATEGAGEHRVVFGVAAVNGQRVERQRRTTRA